MQSAATITPCKHTQLSAAKCCDKTLGEVCKEFISHKRNSRVAKIDLSEADEISEHLKHAVHFFGMAEFNIGLLHGKAWQQYFEWNTQVRPTVSKVVLLRERETIIELFQFALHKNYVCEIHMPIFYRQKSAEDAFFDWLLEQDVKWGVFTLHFPYFKNEDDWRQPISEFFTILERQYVKSTIKKHRERANEPIHYRVVYMGGDAGNKVSFHCQGTLELMDGNIELLGERMEKIWKSVVRNHRHRFPAGIYEDESAWLPSATVWVEEFEIPEDKSELNYHYYLSRFEGNSLKFGVNKIVYSSATTLKPPSN